MNALQWLRAGSLAWGLVAVCDVAAEPTNDPAQAAAQAAAARFRALDVNHDGLLSRYEYDAEVVFETADTDHDGVDDGDEDADHDGVDNEDEDDDSGDRCGNAQGDKDDDDQGEDSSGSSGSDD